MKISTDRNIALGALFVSILAFFLSIQQGCENRTHNKLTVRPELRLEANLSLQDRPIGISIRNVGFGPARITVLSFSTTTVSHSEHSNSSPSYIASANGISGDWLTSIRPTLPFTLASNESIPIYSIDPDIYSIQKRLFNNFFSRLKVDVHFKSVYNEEWAKIFELGKIMSP